MQDNLDKVIQKEIEEKIKLGTDSMASSLGALVARLDEKAQIEIIAKAIEDFSLLKNDKSGYYFAYKGHINVAHPNRKDLIGTSLENAKDSNESIMCKNSIRMQRKARENLYISYFLNHYQMGGLARHKRLRIQL